MSLPYEKTLKTTFEQKNTKTEILHLLKFVFFIIHQFYQLQQSIKIASWVVSSLNLLLRVELLIAS